MPLRQRNERTDEPHPSLGLGFSAYSEERKPCSHEAEATRLRGELEALRIRIEEVDRKAEQQTDGEEWITGYTLPVGPWHRLLAEARK